MKPPPLLTEAEYEALPVSIQRKYFSPVERLQIAENAVRLRAPSSQIRPSSASNRLSRNVAHGVTSLQRSSTKQRRRLKKSESVWRDYEVTRAETEWFLSLPDKVRRLGFSREEQVLLAGAFEDILPGTTEEGSRNWRRWQEQDLKPPPTPVKQRRRSISEGVPPEADAFVRTSYFIDNNPRQSDNMAAFEAHVSKQRRRSSFKRPLSLSANPFTRHSTSSVPAVPSSPLFPFYSSHNRPRAATNVQQQHNNEPPPAIIDPAAIYYQDPEARMKLRLYLASPQKFDEVVEFGFPSSHSNEPPPTTPNPPHLQPTDRTTSHDYQAFLKHDAVSFLDASDHDPDSDSDASSSYTLDPDSPITPAADGGNLFRYSSSTPSSSLDSAGLPPACPITALPPLPSKLKHDLIADALAGNREMTLRMTLTRPDLRADEEVLYGWQQQQQQQQQQQRAAGGGGVLVPAPASVPGGRDDPLALDELPPVEDDETGAQGVFAVKQRRGGVVGRFLRRVKG